MNLPLILATEEYAKHKNNRTRLFQHLQDWGKEHPIIFVGYDLSDPNVQQIFYDIGDSAASRSQFIMVRPGLNEFDMRYWNQRRVVPVKATFEDFLGYLDDSCPKPKRQLSTLFSGKDSSTLHFKTGAIPTDLLMFYLKQELNN